MNDQHGKDALPKWALETNRVLPSLAVVLLPQGNALSAFQVSMYEPHGSQPVEASGWTAAACRCGWPLLAERKLRAPFRDSKPPVPLVE